jgi:hypothetical protein
MKKFITFFMLFVFGLSLCACHNQKYDILSYQEKEIYAECTLNGEYKIKISKQNSTTCVGFLAPSSLSSIEFIITENGVVGKSGELEIPLEKATASGICAVSMVFSLSEGDLTCVKSQGKESYMEFSNEYGTYKLLLGENSLPKSVEIVSSAFLLDITFDAILLK